MTVRSVFVLKPDKTSALELTYPASTGRNFDEILRVLILCNARRAGLWRARLWRLRPIGAQVTKPLSIFPRPMPKPMKSLARMDIALCKYKYLLKQEKTWPRITCAAPTFGGWFGMIIEQIDSVAAE